MRVPETKFTWNGDVSLAYQIVSDAGIDLLYLPGGVSNVDVMWESSRYSGFLERLASFSRLIVMDRRGTGCSERFSPSEVAPLEVMVDDIITVLDAVGSERAALFSFEEANTITAMTRSRGNGLAVNGTSRSSGSARGGGPRRSESTRPRSSPRSSVTTGSSAGSRGSNASHSLLAR